MESAAAVAAATSGLDSFYSNPPTEACLTIEEAGAAGSVDNDETVISFCFSHAENRDYPVAVT